MLTLGIESSCDDTAVAVLEDDSHLLSNLVSSQNDIHTRFGGVVPELASRQHLLSISPLLNAALQEAGITLEEIDLIAATQGPGLIGSLLVGFSFAKSLSYVSGIPMVGVDHMAGHILSVFLEKKRPSFPFLALVVSGGTSSIFRCNSTTSFALLGRTRDDAAGEAFDKVAKLLGLGYPGGPIVSAHAETGNPEAFSFPRSWLDENSCDFSFSGLKTAVSQCASAHRERLAETGFIADICASFQEAVVDVLVQKTIQEAERQKIHNIVIGGGVSSNNRLRAAMQSRCDQQGFTLFTPPPSRCTDNGAMIAIAGYYTYKTAQKSVTFREDVYSRSQFL